MAGTGTWGGAEALRQLEAHNARVRRIQLSDRGGIWDLEAQLRPRTARNTTAASCANPSDLTDEEWMVIAPLIPREARRQQADDR